MSNARSPREVCSTTIGTSGLTVLASFRVSASFPAWVLRGPAERPAAALGATLAIDCGGESRSSWRFVEDVAHGAHELLRTERLRQERALVRGGRAALHAVG